MNVTPSMRRALGASLPDGGALLTGPEMAEAVLEPLAATGALAGRVLIRHEVRAVGRAGLTRMDFAGHPLRAERPFRILAGAHGADRVFEADVVCDASGVSGANPVGAGGLPAPGESAVEAGMIRDLGTLHDRLEILAGRRILLVGHGHSAATAIVQLTELAHAAPGTRVTWAVRSFNRRPCLEVSGDPLPERGRVASGANDLAAQPPPFLTVHRRASVERLTQVGGAIAVSFSAGREGVFDAVVSLTGYRPDLKILAELAVEISPVTEGAARLSRALANVTDCLSVPAVAARDLASGEPGFFLAGAKSYGRARTFLLQTGFAQLQTLLDGMSP